MQIPAEAVMYAAQNGSPALISSVGRLFGLGEEEQSALVRGEVPRWAVFALGIVAGAAVGVFVQRKYPDQVSKLVGV